ncbi:hypothetical protein HAX54_010805 [Datura stramonium]|uniref:Uncharacterized protein n=1 Tax=Datura stramonium TaxID=4076 RepID=A0ABS8RWR8_DATST|nr:hypothetical protein [Datura stramonium]
MRTADDFKKDLRLIISNSSQSGIEFFDTAAAANLRVRVAPPRYRGETTMPKIQLWIGQSLCTKTNDYEKLETPSPPSNLQQATQNKGGPEILNNRPKNHGKKYRTCCVIAVVAQIEQSGNVTPYGCVRALVAALRSCYSLLSNYTNIHTH